MLWYPLAGDNKVYMGSDVTLLLSKFLFSSIFHTITMYKATISSPDKSTREERCKALY